MSAHLWYAIETPAGRAASVHEMELQGSDTVLFKDADSGRVRDWVRDYNARVLEEQRRFFASQPSLFGDDE